MNKHVCDGINPSGKLIFISLRVILITSKVVALKITLHIITIGNGIYIYYS